MAEQKTKPTAQTIDEFLVNVPDFQKREDAYKLIALMEKVTGEQAKMWGPSIIGFGQYQYQYESGHKGYSCLTGFSPRKPSLSLYIMGDYAEQDDLLSKLGKYKKAKGCLYVKKLSDIDLNVLEQMIIFSVDALKKRYPDE